MNKKIALTSAATCAAAVAAALAGSLPAASQEPAAQTFSLCTQEQSGFDRMIDVGRKGFSPGDYSVGVKSLFDAATARALSAGRREGLGHRILSRDQQRHPAHHVDQREALEACI